MARSNILDPTKDLQKDSGAVLFSFIRGEQQEYPVIIDFVDDITNYILEAVIVEGLNVVSIDEIPTQIADTPVVTTLNIRKPSYTGEWNISTSYDKDDVVLFQDLYYILISGTGYIGTEDPSLDSNWSLHTKNTIFIRFPKELVDGWDVVPTPNSTVYGFFELSISEPSGAFPRIWKPVRGLIQFGFSPTESN